MNDQVWAVLFTLALPSRVDPLNTPRVSPLARAAERVPEKVGVASSVTAPLATLPLIKPTLSAVAVMAAVVVGAVVSTEAV